MAEAILPEDEIIPQICSWIVDLDRRNRLIEQRSRADLIRRPRSAIELAKRVIPESRLIGFPDTSHAFLKAGKRAPLIVVRDQTFKTFELEIELRLIKWCNHELPSLSVLCDAKGQIAHGKRCTPVSEALVLSPDSRPTLYVPSGRDAD
jgi:hypothetical protein